MIMKRFNLFNMVVFFQLGTGAMGMPTNVAGYCCHNGNLVHEGNIYCEIAVV